jgi:copper(I)-binding protein
MGGTVMVRRHLRRLPAAFAIAILAGVACIASEPRPPRRGVDVSNAVIAAPAGDSPAAMYATVTNHDTTLDSLVAVSTAAAERAELHEQMTHAGAMMMHPIAALPIAAHARVALAPGGVHVMLIGLRKHLSPGDSITATFHFKRGGAVSTWARVVSYADLEQVLDSGSASLRTGR